MAQQDQFVIIDKIKWWVWTKDNGSRGTQPICLKHDIRIYPKLAHGARFSSSTNYLQCAECNELHIIPRGYDDEKQYVLDKTESKTIKGVKFINLDDEALPIAKDKIKKNSEYFVTSLLTQSKLGLRLVVYAGKKGSDQKTQIFVEPEIRRLAFDQGNLHPTDIFTKLEATFVDGTKSTQKRKKSTQKRKKSKEKA